MNYIEIGKVKKPHGLSGEIKATIEEKFWADVAAVEAFFIDIKGEIAPYFLESIRGKETLILKFEDIDTKEDASLFTNKRIYLRAEDVTLTEEEMNDTGLEFSYLEGYVLYEEEAGEVGNIEYVAEYPQQEMAGVAYKGKEILIPLLETWILSVDKDKKIVKMALPEGLLEI